MQANLTNIRLTRTFSQYPKVTFTVTLGEANEDGDFVPKYESEGWSLYRKKGKEAKDDRGIAGTTLKLPMVPLLYKVGASGLYRKATFITTQACEEGLLSAIHAAILSKPRVRSYMGLDKGDKALESKVEIENNTEVFEG